MALRRREDIEAREGVDVRQLAREEAGSLSWNLLVLAAVVLVLGVSIQLRHRWDVSQSRKASLSPQTLAVLEGIEDEVRIYPLFTSENPMRSEYWHFLELYREASDRIRVEFIDPVAQPGAVNRLGLDPEQENARRDGMTVVARGDARRIFQGTEEEHVTNALLDVTSAAPRVVGFIRGYGEKDPASDRDSGLSRAAGALRQEYYDLVDVPPARGIPEQVTVLVAAGLRLPLGDAELSRLSAWLEDGGRLLVLQDPGVDVGLNRVLDRWGLRLTGRQVLEPRLNLNNDPQFVKASEYSKHEIVEGFGANLPSVFPVVGSVEHFEPGDPLVYHDDLVLTTIVSSTMVDGERATGPFSLAAASWRRDEAGDLENETRVVAVGDSDFATNQFLYFRANRNLFLNCIGWLSREQNLVSIRRQPLADQVLDLGPEDKGWLTAATYVVPVLLLVAQAVVYVRRRRL